MIFTKLLSKLSKAVLTRVEGDIYFSPMVITSFRTVLDGLDWKLEHGGAMLIKHNKFIDEMGIKIISDFMLVENRSKNPEKNFKPEFSWRYWKRLASPSIGDWHTHPSGLIVPSPDDDKVMFNKSMLRGIPWYMGIVGIKGAGHVPIFSESGLIMSTATIMLYELKLWEYFKGERKEIAEIII